MLIAIYCPQCGHHVGMVNTFEGQDAKPIDGNIAAMPITDIPWKTQRVRILSTLQADHIGTVGELLQLTEAELMRCPNFGKISLDEIKKRLRELGLQLGMSAR